MSLEVLRQVRQANADAAERDRERRDAAAESNPNGTADREGVPVDDWRALPPSPG